MEYEVICTSVYNGSVVIDAPSAEDDVKKAQEMINNHQVEFVFGEQTA